MRNVLLIGISILLFTSGFSQGTWTQKSDFGGGNRNFAVGFSIGNFGYVGLGRDSFNSNANDFWKYDASLDVWTQIANFGGAPRTGAIAFTIGAEAYVGTGRDISNIFYNDMWQYSPLSNSWTQKNNFGGTARMYATAFSVGGYGFVGTGLTTNFSSSVQSDFWKYDPSNDSWTLITFPGTGRGPGVGFSIGSKAYFGTGNDVADYPLNDFWEFDPSNNSWAPKSPVPAFKCAATGFSIGNKGYVGTGQDSLSNTNDFWQYDPSLDQWTPVASFGGSTRRHAVSFTIGSKAYVGTGSDNADFWEFDPTAVGVSESVLKFDIRVYPNPASESIGFRFDDEQKKAITIYDSRGSEVFSSTFQSNYFEVDVRNFSTGIYMYSIKQNGNLSKGNFSVF